MKPTGSRKTTTLTTTGGIEMSYTPGPWVIDPLQIGTRWNVDEVNGNSVALAAQRKEDGRGGPTPMRDANARLIAAAPQLLEALKRIVEELPTRKDWLDPVLEQKARAAIRAAEGEE